ncbi:MAG: type II toxin-antitoxin system death-on-curing family toxin [Candidatus Nitrotoga sp.]|nr:type II toxin-antitoxin system death-on-curing family toxin [Candidatus Nitrotoga sp.]
MEILIENQRVKSEFDRWREHFGEHDPYKANGNMGIQDVLRAHFLIADYFYGENYGIGGIGPKDPNLLHSAVYRQFTGFDGNDKWETPFERCATLIFGLVKDHPFYDANKRTALLVLLYFLKTIKRTPTVYQIDLENFIVDIAENNLDKHSRYKALKLKKDDAEIYFIADYMRRHSRVIDKQSYTITYRELDYCLKKFKFCLSNPNKNFIDVCRIEDKRSFLGLGKIKTKIVKIAHIGFPGWKCQVGKGAIATVRRETKLVPEKGVDSESFYRGTDPLYSLLAEYTGPLERLAYR